MQRSQIIGIVLLGLLTTSLGAAEPRFKSHFIDRDVELVKHAVMSVTLSDLDNDGDLDWTVGTIWPRIGNQKPSRNLQHRMLYWYEHRSAEEWIRHPIGNDKESYGAACVMDVNHDGRMDVIATNLWVNQGEGQWRFHRTGVGDGGHDMQAVDVNGDGQLDVLAFTQEAGLNWFDAGDDFTKPWKKQPIAPSDYSGQRVHACGSPRAAGDLDGDGDIDVAAIHGWFENADSQGTRWNYHRNALFPSTDQENFPWGFAVKTFVCDLDDDGDNDIVQTECDSPVEAGIVWLENKDGKGEFAPHEVVERSAADYHTLRVFDYDHDGDLDIFSGTGPLAKEQHKAAILFENQGKPKGGEENWKRHEIHRGMPIHEGITGDVDGDGDTDIIVKPWNHLDHPKHFLYLENLVIDGAIPSSAIR